ncbi:hypothetical protein BJX61DRAFT_124922 [Aspergillus egyptiacus]|nr:hypothetical protein BJX61DRAFT_124922 [Aspergillus egyptiacus]
MDSTQLAGCFRSGQGPARTRGDRRSAKSGLHDRRQGIVGERGRCLGCTWPSTGAYRGRDKRTPLFPPDQLASLGKILIYCLLIMTSTRFWCPADRGTAVSRLWRGWTSHTHQSLEFRDDEEQGGATAESGFATRGTPVGLVKTVVPG